VRGRQIHLPTLGTVLLPDVDAETAVLSTDRDECTVRVAGRTIATVRATQGDSPNWYATRTVVTDGPIVRLEDADPYRDCYERAVSGRLGEDEAAAWRQAIAAAWAEIRGIVPAYAPGLTVGLSAIAPLLNDGGPVRSATSRNAFGALATTLTSAAELAVVLVHEIQHSKLGAILDLVNLHDPNYRGRVRVAWRPEPRPIEGALQGVYAHLAVADIWRARAHSTADAHALAEYRRYREWTVAGIEAIERTGSLTPRGERFLALIDDTIHGWKV
jgi:uncharacterized protein